MPELFVSEETQNRAQSLCLFEVQGIARTNNRRCANCPGAPRTPQIHQWRCPFDISNESNLFTQAVAAQVGKSEVIIVDPKTSSATSSSSSSSSSSSCAEQHVTENVAVETTSDEIQDDSLDESSQPSGRRPDRSVSDPHSEVIGRRKRKADDWPESASRSEFLADPQGEGFLRSPKRFHAPESIVQIFNSLSISAPISLNQPEGLLPRTEQAVLPNFTAEVNGRTRLSGDQLDGRSDVRQFFRNREQIIFQDHPHNEPTPMAWSINASGNVPLRSLLINPRIMREEDDSHSRALVSSFGIRIAGIGMLGAHQGVPSGSDGVCGADEYSLMNAEEIVGPSQEELLNE